MVAFGMPEQVAAKADTSYRQLPGEDRKAGGAAETARVAGEGPRGGVADQLQHKLSWHTPRFDL